MLRAVLVLKAETADPPDFVVQFKTLADFWKANEIYLPLIENMLDRVHRESGARSVVVEHPRFGSIMGKVYSEGSPP